MEASLENVLLARKCTMLDPKVITDALIMLTFTGNNNECVEQKIATASPKHK